MTKLFFSLGSCNCNSISLKEGTCSLLVAWTLLDIAKNDFENKLSQQNFNSVASKSAVGADVNFTVH